MKITQEQKKQGQEVYKDLVVEAWKNTSFKKELIKNPIKTIEKFTSGKFLLPNNTRIIVDDQTDQAKIYLNIPRKLNLNNFELTDEEMEMVSGGIFFVTAAGVAVVAGLFYTGIKIHDALHPDTSKK